MSTDTATTDPWKKIGTEKRFGISLPLYALHSRTTYGVGEYFELIKLFPWLKSMGFSLVHLLPIYDTHGQINPHLPFSPFAFNPLFLSLTEIPHSSDKEELYLQKTISYSSASKFREALLVKFFYDHGALVFQSSAFQSFKEESPWLDEYVGLKGGDPKYHQFVQFLCHQQMEKVKAEAENHGILLIGELPTKLQPNSPDVKYHPSWFTVKDETAFCDYDRMGSEDFSWWKDRLHAASKYFHCCKLDASINHPDFIDNVINQNSSLTLLPANNTAPSDFNGNACPILTYPESTLYPSHSTTELITPTSPLSPEQYAKLIKDSHATESLLHITPLRTYLSLIPELNWTALASEEETEWKQFFKPSIETLINHQPLREAMETCIG